MLVSKTIEDFSRILASDAPAPGGGSVAALSGALGADLVCMVCNLSTGRAEFTDNEKEIVVSLEAARGLSQLLLECVDRDTEAFNGVIAAFKMPKASDDEKAARTAAIQEGYKEAIQSPLRIARACFSVMETAERLMGKTNKNALSDLTVGAEQAQAGLMGALFNVRINLPSIKDTAFADETRVEADDLTRKSEAVLQRTRAFFLKEVA